MKKIILASQSPTRRKILEDMGLSPHIMPLDADEDYGTLTAPEKIVMRLSEIKARAAMENLSASDETLVITADTLVFFGGNPIGKPSSIAEARLTLAALSNNSHEVYTGFTLMYGGVKYTDYECTKVFFRRLTQDEIDRYTSDKACLTKAGSYGAEGVAAAFIKRTEGDYFNIGGLPVCKISEKLRDVFGISIFDFAECRSVVPCD